MDPASAQVAGRIRARMTQLSPEGRIETGTEKVVRGCPLAPMTIVRLALEEKERATGAASLARGGLVAAAIASSRGRSTHARGGTLVKTIACVDGLTRHASIAEVGDSQGSNASSTISRGPSGREIAKLIAPRANGSSF